MKKLLTSVLLVLLSIAGYSQSPTRGALSTVDTAALKPTIKMLAVNSLDNTVVYWNGSSWEAVSSGGTTDTASLSNRIIELDNKTSPIPDIRIDSAGYHTAFGVSVKSNDTIIIAQSEGPGHPLAAGTRPVIYLSLNNGVSYTKLYLSLTGISGSASDDIRNLAGGKDNNGKVWIFATDYRNAAEILPTRLWYWTSEDAGVTWSDPTEITYNTTVYPNYVTTYGELIDFGSGVMIIPAYGAKGDDAESFAIQFKTIDSGTTWTATKMYVGDNTSGSDQITETFIKRTTGNNLIAIGRREQSKPRLLSSSDAGANWTNEGVLTAFPSMQCHAPWIYMDGSQVSCLYSDRSGLNVGRISVVENYNDDAEWNAAKREVILGSVTQRGFGAYNYGYTSTIGTGANRMMVWYDISLDENNPASLTDALTGLIVSPLVTKPMFLGRIGNASFAAGGAEEDIFFDSTLIDVDNAGWMDRSDYKKLRISEDGIYQISLNLRVGSMSFASYTQLTMYSNFKSTAFNDQTYGQGGAIGQGFGFINFSGVRHLRKGEEIYFKLYSSTAGPLAVNLDNTPYFTIIKVN